MTFLIRIGWVATLLVLLLSPSNAAAQGGTTGGYSLAVDSDPPTAVSYERLAAMLATDLGAPPAESGRVAIVVRYRDRKLTVRADHGQGRVLERTIEADEATAEREASLLASNLARDESRELLEAMEAKHPPPAPAPEPPNAARSVNRYASAQLVYPLSTTFGEPDAKVNLDFTLLFGRTGVVHGTQIGSFVHYTSREVRGAQVNAFASLAGAVHGVQIGGALDVAREINGVQAGPIGIAHDVNGLQFGAINIASKVKGAQIGAINIADEVDGVQLGAFSLNRNGLHPFAFTTNLAFTNVGLKFSTKWVYTSFAVSFHTLETDFDRIGTTGAVGGHVPLDALLEHLDLEPEVALVSVNTTRNSNDNNLWLSGRVTAGYNFAAHLRLFAGGGARFPLIVGDGREVVRPEAIAGVQF